MKKMNFSSIVFSIAALCGSLANASGYTQDTGTITTLYVNDGGVIAIKLSGGFPAAANGSATGLAQCSTANQNGYAGNSLSTTNPLMKSTLLAAKAAQQIITVTIQGCDSNTSWYQITDVYVN